MALEYFAPAPAAAADAAAAPAAPAETFTEASLTAMKVRRGLREVLGRWIWLPTTTPSMAARAARALCPLTFSVPHLSPPGAAAQGAVPAAQHCHQGAQEGRARLVAALPAPAKAVDGLERRRWTVAFFAWVPSARTRASSKTARRAAEHSLLPLDSHMPGRHPNVRRVGERCRVCAHVPRVGTFLCF